MVNSNGAIVPSTADLNAAVHFLVNGIISNPGLNVKFRANPVGYLGAIGIPTDGIPEIMRELGLVQEAAAIAICGWTCFWTGCAFTCWYTGTSASGVVLTATASPLS